LRNIRNTTRQNPVASDIDFSGLSTYVAPILNYSVLNDMLFVRGGVHNQWSVGVTVNHLVLGHTESCWLTSVGVVERIGFIAPSLQDISLDLWDAARDLQGLGSDCSCRSHGVDGIVALRWYSSKLSACARPAGKRAQPMLYT
jgi:hypothetical protein